jgi:hypothetical protein
MESQNVVKLLENGDESISASGRLHTSGAKTVIPANIIVQKETKK